MKWIIAFVIGLALLWSQPLLVSAHAELRTATPTIGAVLWGGSPAVVRLTFSEVLILERCTLIIMRPDFSRVDVGAKQGNPDNPKEMSITVPPLTPGIYTVLWRSASPDGDTVVGSYDFVVLSQAQIEQRWRLVLGGVVAVIGILAGLVWVRRRASVSGS